MPLDLLSPAALRDFEPGQIREEAALRIPRRCRGFFLSTSLALSEHVAPTGYGAQSVRPQHGGLLLGDHGHPHAIFQRAIERGNLVAAEAAAREMGSLTLVDALELTALVASKDRGRSRRMAARWLARWLGEAASPTIDDAAMVAGCLVALGGDAREPALWTLRELLAGEVKRPRVSHAASE